MLEQFQTYVRGHNLCQKGQCVLLAVSGGMDSIVMTDLFYRANYAFVIAHFNFCLRGREADEDEQFVRQIAEQYGVPCHVKRKNPAQNAKEHGISIQMAARELRYAWLEETRKHAGCSAIATAHHKDDSIETMLMNLVKGTGIRGMHGILPKIGHVIRPLLFGFRSDIETYVRDHQLPYREDSTNQSIAYERNYIRHQALPVLETLNPSLRQTLSDTTERFYNAEMIYEQGVRYYRKKLLVNADGIIYIPIRKLQQLNALETILYELLKDFGFQGEHVIQIAHSLNEQPGKQFFSPDYRLIKDRKFLILTPKTEEEKGPFFIPESKKKLTIGQGQLKFQQADAGLISIKKDPAIAFLDYDQLSFPLTLRRWKSGDYLYPLVDEKKGQKAKKKKLKRFLTDEKLSLLQKEKIWVLTSGERIVWIIGHRIDNRFKVTDRTNTILKVKWFPK